jgi:peptidoglycan/LPS O-acetylase OafA/YrhL
MGNDRASHFRPDIEGLRAVAIGAVLLYHAGVPGAGGGFVGVDVFFVISGFLITGLLLREWSGSARIDLVAFYARRFRRLLPAAILVIAITTLASYHVLSSVRFPGVAGDAAAAALYVSNMRFAAGAVDYLGTEVAPSPLLHYWSLSLEEQFYLFWPLVLVVALRFLSPRWLGPLLGLMVVVSFGLALVWTDLAAPLAFFSLPTRAWQLGVGALIAVGLLRLPGRAPRGVPALCVWLGLGCIVAAVVLIDAQTPYPGVAATLPVLGTALVVIGGKAGSTDLGRADRPPWPSRLLAAAGPRWVGRISYSLYLWHWPILVLVPIALGADDLVLDLVLVGVAVLVAAASTELVEMPIRQGRRLRLAPRASLAAAGAASVAMAVGALTAVALVLGPVSAPAVAGAPALAIPRAGDPPEPVRAGDLPEPLRAGPLPEPVRAGPLPANLTPTLAGAYYDVPAGYRDGCHLDYLEVEPPACTYGASPASTSVLLLGDSHAQQWLPALGRLAEARGWGLRALTKSGCPMVEATVWNSALKRAFRECDVWRERALALIEEERPQLVILAAADMYELVDERGIRLGEGGEAAWDTALEVYLTKVAERAPQVVLLADTPRLDHDPVDCLATHQDIAACGTDRDDMVDEDYRAREAAAAGAAGVGLVPTSEWVCASSDCPLVRGPYLVYRDRHHLTATYAATLSVRLGEAIDALAGGALGTG